MEKTLKDLFVPYEIALLAKKNGFNEDCLTRWGENSKKLYEAWKPMKNSEDGEDFTAAPLYQQLIDWFRIEHDILIWVETATYVNMFNYRYYIETYDNKAEGMKTNNYYEALNDAIKKAFKMIPQICDLQDEINRQLSAKLPENWAVKNDGSQLFKDTVVKYLNEKHKNFHEFTGKYNNEYYGYSVNNTFVMDWLPENTTELTIDQFIELTK